MQYHTASCLPVFRLPIYDAHKNILAETEKKYALYYVNSHGLPLAQATCNFLKERYPHTLKDILENPKKKFFYLAHHVASEYIKSLVLENLDGVGFHQENKRVYPYPYLLPIIGMTDIDLVGTAGLEYLYNKYLLVPEQKVNQEKNSYQIVNNIFDIDKKKSIETTLSTYLSGYITTQLEKLVKEYQSYYAVAMVMDGVKGDIIAYSQFPYYKNAQDDIFFSKPLGITDSHEMGSVLKAFFALSALESGVVLPQECIDCKNTKTLSFKHFLVNTWKPHGVIPFSEVIAQSNNIGTAFVAQKIPKNIYYDCYKKCGFGQKTGIELPGESGGFLQPLSKWSVQTPISLSYGYEVSSTLIQIMTAWTLFINEGRMVYPRILKLTPIRMSQQLFSINSINEMRSILYYAPEKIPHRFKKQFELLNIYGKTGTANILENGSYNKEKNTYSFIGSVEGIGSPKIIGIYIYLSNKKNMYASAIALPLFYEIIEKLHASYLNKTIF